MPLEIEIRRKKEIHGETRDSNPNSKFRSKFHIYVNVTFLCEIERPVKFKIQYSILIVRMYLDLNEYSLRKRIWALRLFGGSLVGSGTPFCQPPHLDP